MSNFKKGDLVVLVNTGMFSTLNLNNGDLGFVVSEAPTRFAHLARYADHFRVYHFKSCRTILIHDKRFVKANKK